MVPIILVISIFTGSLRYSDSTATKMDSLSGKKINVGTTVSNINNQPEWGPSGYEYVEYYYMPDIETYYDVAHHQYIYYSNFRWNFSSFPPKYRQVDMYNCYKVVLNEPKPYLHFKEHQQTFAQYKGLKEKQVNIKNCQEGEFRNCWKNCSPKVQSWETCTQKRTRRNLKAELAHNP